MIRARSILVLCALILQLAACNKDVADSSASLPVTASSIAGDFTVNSFVNGSDQTSAFNNYRFTFSENGIVTATEDNTTVSGSWMFDDGNSTELKIHFSDSPFTELNKSWHVAELTAEHLLLTDDDGGEDNGDDNSKSQRRLEFERD